MDSPKRCRSRSIRPIVDTSNATTGQDITLQLTESLPTGRSYQSYLQLVPGVLPDDPQQPGNPASKSGVNYGDIGGNVGVSSDNYYYFNGINVTDPVSGTFGSNLNTEIIQEQKVLTGGIPAEFVGTPGLLSSVITKSGTNAFHGSGNYFFQNANLVADNKNSANEEFSTFDAAGTIGGPICPRPRLVLRQLPQAGARRRRDDPRHPGVHADGEERAGSGLREGHVGAEQPATRVSFTFLNDPTDISGRRDRNLTNARDRARVQGGDNYSLNYSRVQGTALLEVGYNVHNGEVTDLSAIRQASNTVVYRASDSAAADRRAAWWLRPGPDQPARHEGRSWLRPVQLGSPHPQGWSRVVGERELPQHDVHRFGNVHDSAARSGRNHRSGARNRQLQRCRLQRHQHQRFRRPDQHDQRACRTGRSSTRLFDANGDGTITAAEMGPRLTFDTVADGLVQYDRTFQSELGPQLTSSKGLSFFVQDQFTFGRDDDQRRSAHRAVGAFRDDG